MDEDRWVGVWLGMCGGSFQVVSTFFSGSRNQGHVLIMKMEHIVVKVEERLET